MELIKSYPNVRSSTNKRTMLTDTYDAIFLQIQAKTLQWRHNGRGSVSNHRPPNCLLNRWFRRRSKKTSKLHVTGLCAENSPHKWPVTRICFHLMTSSWMPVSSVAYLIWRSLCDGKTKCTTWRISMHAMGDTKSATPFVPARDLYRHE